MARLYRKNVQSGKLDVHYLTGGQGEPMVVIHGGGNGSNSWLQIAENLSNSNTLYIPDLPGFGGTKLVSKKLNLLDFVSFIEDFSNSLGINHFSLIGHSVGGYVAAQYTLRFPGKVHRLVLVGSLGLGKEIALWVRVLSSVIFRKCMGKPLLAILKILWRLACSVYSPFKYILPFSQVKMDIGKSITNLKGQTIVLLDSLSELLIPTLIVWGAKDIIVPVEHAYAAEQVIPNSRVHIFENVGHNIHNQIPDEFSEVLNRFLS